MLTNAQARDRVIAALDKAWSNMGQDAGELTYVDLYRVATAAITAAFEPCDDWQVEEYEPSKDGYRWRLRNRRTGELYTTPTRGDRNRFVTFKRKIKAAVKAYEMNLEGSEK
jgi:hypothetical protein